MNIKQTVFYILGRLMVYMRTCEEFYTHKKYKMLSNQDFNYVNQGSGGLTIAHPENLQMDVTSHFKSNSFVECSGGVKIGRYFHTGRGLTIFTSVHNYDGGDFIPYNNESILKEVIIKDFVWCGANVTILPGVTIGEGAVIGAGSVVVRDIPDYAIAVGNPAKVVKFRNIESFLKLKEEKKFC